MNTQQINEFKARIAALEARVADLEVRAAQPVERKPTLTLPKKADA